jgi:HAD superfamily hydrolase (TIGR01509 family)
MPVRALIWDVDGTLAETERDGHLVAFNAAFEALGVPWRWSVARYGELLAVTGGFERLLHDMATQPEAPVTPAERERLARQLHLDKNQRYAQIVAAGRIPLRDGVRALMDDCRAAGVPMAIATTTSRSNVEALLGAHLGAAWREWFAGVLCGEDAPRKKPDPQVYALALGRLGLPANEVLAIEDSPVGVRACVAAGVPVVVTRSVYFADAEFPGALAVGPGLGSAEGWSPALPSFCSRIDLDSLRNWFAPSPSGRDRSSAAAADLLTRNR